MTRPPGTLPLRRGADDHDGASAPGFEGHAGVLVMHPSEFTVPDPFILLAADRLDLPDGSTIGGEHPLAGFEARRSPERGSC